MREIDQQFALHLTWMDPNDPDDMARQLKRMEADSEALRRSLPSAEQLASQSVDKLAGAYWRRDQGLPVKTFGIYLAYPPTLDLRAEGLGRHLAEFLKEAKSCPTARFVIACPSWMRKSLDDLLEGVGIPRMRSK